MAASLNTSLTKNLQLAEVSNNKENIRLIWLDSNINTSKDCVHTKTRLLECNPAAKFYTDPIQCTTLIKSISNEQVLLIVSGALSRAVLSQVHDLRHVVAVFIFCNTRTYHAELSSRYSKVMDTFSNQNELLESIYSTMQVVEKQLLAFHLFDQKQNSYRDLSKNSALFVRHQLLLNALKKMPRDEQAKNDLVEICLNFYGMNRTELEKIKRFQNSYTSEQAIGWYTEECFLYKLLNRAIRTEDTELLYAFRFFIIDLCAALERESKKLQSDNILTVYRGQQIPGEELEKLCHSVGKLISMNGFLSTSRQIDVALQFAPVLRTTRDMQPCIIEIQIDPTLNALMCADISEYSSVKEEDEILFGLNAIFKLDSVQMDSDLRMWKIKLSATTEGLTRIEKYIELQEDEMKECSPLICFGCLLLDEFGQVEQAEKHFNKLLTCLPPDNHSDMSDLYNSMGHVCRHKGDINQALDKYERSYRIRQKFLTPNHPKIARSLYNIGLVYQIKEEYNHALNSFREALAIQNKIYSEDHIEKARTFQSIGLTYQPMGEFDMALAWLNRALDMYTRIHLLSHRDVANCLGHIGALYEKKGDLDRTIDFYHRRLEINEDILPSDHTILPIHLKDLILVYKKKHRLKKTLAFCEMKLASQKAILGDTHHRIASTLMIMGDISKPDKLRRYYEQALTVLQSCKPRNNQIMLVCLERLGEISLSESKSCEGLRYWQQICEIQSEIYQSDHPEIGSCLERLGDIYLNNFDNCRVALRYYRESLVVYQANYVSERQSIDEVQKKIQKVQRKLKE